MVTSYAEFMRLWVQYLAEVGRLVIRQTPNDPQVEQEIVDTAQSNPLASELDRPSPLYIPLCQV